jgi:hypothetical protein
MAESHNFLSADAHSQHHSQLANRSDHESNHPPLANCAFVRIAPWRVRDLKTHPSYAQLGVKIPASRLNELIDLGEDAFVFPLFVTSTGIVIDGYARLEIARLQGRETIMCVEFDIPEEEALRRLILCHRRPCRPAGLLPGQACATSGEISQRKGASAPARWREEQGFVKINRSSNDRRTQKDRGGCRRFCRHSEPCARSP